MASETLIKEKKNERTEPWETLTKKISVCDIMKNNTSKVIKKMESQIPSYVEQYSDLYAEYLHMVDDLFGNCYLSEKEFFDKFGFDQRALKAFDDYYNNLTDDATRQIEMSTSLLKSFMRMQIPAIQAYDKYMHAMMDSYANLMSQYIKK